MIRHINDSISADAPWLKTYAGALKRIHDFTQKMAEGGEASNPSPTSILTLVVHKQTPDGDRYVPAVILGRDASPWALNIALHYKCWVTNVL